MQSEPNPSSPHPSASSSGPDPLPAPGADLPPTPAPRGSWIGWVLLVLLIVGITGAAAFQALVQGSGEPVPPPVKAAPQFALTDDKGTSFSATQLGGMPYVIDFIFTRCGSQCPAMTVQMRDLQVWLEKRGHNDFRLVSVTVDPEYDTPEVLADYGDRFKADRTRWKFLTGSRQDVYPMIQTGFMLGVEENKGLPVEEQFIHSDKFVLVDAAGQIRGFYTATDDEQMKELRRVIESMSAERKAGQVKTR